MNTDFINIPEADLHGPETEAQDYAEEVRKVVARKSDSPESTQSNLEEDMALSK